MQNVEVELLDCCQIQVHGFPPFFWPYGHRSCSYANIMVLWSKMWLNFPHFAAKSGIEIIISIYIRILYVSVVSVTLVYGANAKLMVSISVQLTIRWICSSRCFQIHKNVLDVRIHIFHPFFLSLHTSIDFFSTYSIRQMPKMAIKIYLIFIIKTVWQLFIPVTLLAPSLGGEINEQINRDCLIYALISENVSST